MALGRVKKIESGCPIYVGYTTRCDYYRTTLLEYGDLIWVIATNGRCRDAEWRLQKLGGPYYYRTRVFKGEKICKGKKLDDANWRLLRRLAIEDCDFCPDYELEEESYPGENASRSHDATVRRLSKAIRNKDAVRLLERSTETSYSTEVL